MGENKVFINKHDVIELVVVGDQTVDSVRTTAAEGHRLIVQQHEQGKLALVLQNLLNKGNVPADARKLVVEQFKTFPYDKLALTGENVVQELAAQLLLHASGKSDRAKYFNNYDNAIEWLTSD